MLSAYDIAPPLTRGVDRQPASGACPENVALDVIGIQLDDRRYWLYRAVDLRRQNPPLLRSLRREIKQAVS